MEHIAPYLEKYSYLGIFVLILLCSFVVPGSKTLIVVAGGVLAAEDMGNLYLYMGVSIIALVTADSIYFGIGRLFGERVMNMPYFRKANRRERLIEAQRRLMTYGWLAVFSARFTPFLRALIFVVAGASGMPYARFFQADALSAFLMVPLVATIGYLVAEKRSVVYNYISEAEYVLAILLAIAILMFLFFPRRGKEDSFK